MNAVLLASQYFIRLLSTGLTDNSTQSPWATYSANFTLTGMTGTFPQGIDAGELKPGDNHTRVWDHECSCHKNKETGKEDNTPNPPAVQPSELPQHNNAVPSSVVPGTPTTIKVGTPATTQPAHAIVSGSANATNPQNAAAGNPLANSSVPSAIPSIVTMTNHGGVVVTVTALCGCEDDLQHTVPASQSLTTTVITNSDGTQTITVPCEQTQSLANAIANPSITAPPGSSGAVVPVNAAVPTPSSTTSLHTKEDGSVETVTVPCKSGATGTAPLPAITTSLSTQPDGSVETVTVPCESSGAAAPVISDGSFLGGGGGGNEPQVSRAGCDWRAIPGLTRHPAQTSVYATTNASFTGMVTVTKPCEVCQHHSGAATGAPGANATSTGKTNGTNWGDQINHLLNGGDSPRMGSPVALLGTALLGVGAAFTLLA